MTRDTDTNTNDTEQGSTQLTLPYIESGQRINGTLLRDLAFLIPAVVPVAGSTLLFFLTGNTATYRGTLPATAILAAFCWLLSKTTNYEFSHPIDKVRGSIRRVTALRAFPKSHEEFVEAPEHGYARLFDSGIGEMDDGRFVAFLRAPSRNTHKQTASEANQMVLELTSAIQREFEDSVAIYQTTFDTDPDAYLAKWREQRYSDRFGGRAWQYVRAYLDDLLEFERREDETWDARERQTYIMVQARPREVRSQSTADSESAGLIESLYTTATDDGPSDYQRKQLERLIDQRIQQARNVAQSVADGDVSMVSPGEHALLIAKYWTGTEPAMDDLHESDAVAMSVWPDVDEYAADADDEQRDAPHRPAETEQMPSQPLATADVMQPAIAGDGGEVQTQAVKSTVDAATSPDDDSSASFYARLREGLFNPIAEESDADLADDRIMQRLSPSAFDVRDGIVETGDQYAKTYWLSSWPKEPASNFLSKLQQLRGVDYDLTIRADPIQRSDATHQLETKAENIDASIGELSETRDLDADIMSDEIDYYLAMFNLLKKTSARPWWINAYITVRVGNTRAYDTAEDEVVQGYAEQSTLSLEMAKRRALDAACETILDTIEDEPMAMAPVTSHDRLDQLFRSAFPASRDVYNEDTRKEKRAMTLSGTVAATFPFATGRVQEETGVLFGRNLFNGEKVVADQFARDGASHRLTAGRSGSGKTFFVGDQSLQWWLAGDDGEDGDAT